jgi:hypothetical protein
MQRSRARHARRRTSPRSRPRDREKRLANADRGLDESTSARDLIDLAFAAANFAGEVLDRGFALAEEAYATAVGRDLEAALRAFRDRNRAADCIASLAVDDVATLRRD